MKKVYVTPECTSYVVHTSSLCQLSKYGEDKQDYGNNMGLSKGFGGGLLEDDTQGGGLWDEEI